MLKFRLLGRPRVTLDGRPVTGFVSEKALALLCYLALNEGPQPRVTVAGMLWGRLPEKRARGNLRVAIHNLNNLLPEYIEVTRKQVAFSHDHPHWVDVRAFAETAENERDPQELAGAIALHEGEFLDGLQTDGAPGLEAWLRAERERLHLLMVEMLERLGSVYAKQRRWQEAAGIVRRLLALEPWRERSHRQLMVLLARQGKYAAALAQYEACREILARELGVAPMAETNKLYERILQLRARSRHNLPPAPFPLFGRQQALRLLAGRLYEPTCRLLTIVGLGGIGKSRLALALAQEMIDAFLDGVFYVPLAPITSVTDLPNKIGTALEIPFGNQAPRDALLDYLEDRELLLLLDNYEHLLPDLSLVSLILERCQGVKLLVTSRARLRHRRERIYDLPGLSLEGQVAQTTDGAVGLFLYHARRVQAGFAPDVSQMTQIKAICETVEGAPLAIELAAASTRTAPLEEVVNDVQRDATTLSGTAWGAPARHRTMEAAFDHSWELLNRKEQRLFAGLSIFRGSFTPEAVEAVADATEAQMSSLVDKCLVRREEGRYSVHELLRQYGEWKLDGMAPDEIAQRHMHYYAALLTKEPPGSPAGRTYIGNNLDNIRWAWDTAVRRATYSLLARMVVPLAIFYYGERRWHEEARRRLAAAAAAVRARGDTERPEVQQVLGELIAWVGHFTDDEEESLRLADEAVTLLWATGSGPALATAVTFRGDAAFALRKVQLAIEDLQESRTLVEQSGDLLRLTAPLNSLTQVYTFTGDYQAAERAGGRCVAISDEIGLEKMSCMTRTHLSKALRAQGDYERALARATEALELAERIGTTEHLVISLIRLAEVALDRSRHLEAEARLTTVFNVPHLEVEQPLYRLYAQSLRARNCLAQERFDEARGCLADALKGAVEGQARGVLPHVLLSAARFFVREEPARAVELLTLMAAERWSDAEIKREAEARLADLAEKLPDDQYEAARHRGGRASLLQAAETVRDLLLTKAD